MKEGVWIISVNMGYGHQRTAYSLRNLGKIINANDYEGILEKERKIWEGIRKLYEKISNLYRTPLIGRAVFGFFDRFQKIFSYYPKRDLSEPNFQLKQTFSTIKKGWGKHLIESLTPHQQVGGGALPLITTFFTPAFMAEFFNYPGEIFCVVCDADISRTWAPLNPKTSKIKYFAPTERVTERLKLYGVRKENIFLTGYPLPMENIGSESMEVLKEDLKHRILNLDPQKRYFEKYKELIEIHLGKLPEKSDHPLTILFSVGGAGAQKEIGIKIAKSLRGKIKTGQIKLILSAGIREGVKEYFEENIQKIGFKDCYGGLSSANSLEVLFEKDYNSPTTSSRSSLRSERAPIGNYFQKFNQTLRKTDILWTKPSELSFYAALGLPIIISPPVGSQEEFNQRWLLKSGFGILQENPDYTQEWLFDWLEKGYLAEAAMQGFIEGEKLGNFNIEKIISKCPGF